MKLQQVRRRHAALAVAVLMSSLPGAVDASPLPAVVISEFRRSDPGTMDGGQFIELLITRDTRYSELQGISVGGALASLAGPLGWYSVRHNPGAPGTDGVFRAGTLITIAAPDTVPQDLTYNPAAGDFNITLTTNRTTGGTSQVGSTVALGSSNVLWVGKVTGDMSNPKLTMDQGIVWSRFADRKQTPFAKLANIDLAHPSFPFDEVVYATNAYAGAGTAADFAVAPATARTPGQPNNATQQSGIAQLRALVGRNDFVWDRSDDVETVLEGPGRWQAFDALWTVPDRGVRATWSNLDAEAVVFGSGRPGPRLRNTSTPSEPYRIDVEGAQWVSSLTFRQSDAGYLLAGGQIEIRPDAANARSGAPTTADVQRDTRIDTGIIVGVDQQWHVEPTATLRFSGSLQGAGEVTLVGSGRTVLGGGTTPQLLRSDVRIVGNTVAFDGGFSSNSNATLRLAGGSLEITDDLDLANVSLLLDGGTLKVTAGKTVATAGRLELLGSTTLDITGPGIQQWTLADFDVYDPALLKVTASGLEPGYFYAAAQDGLLTLTLTAVPEPGTLASAFVLAGLGLRRRR